MLSKAHRRVMLVIVAVALATVCLVGLVAGCGSQATTTTPATAATTLATSTTIYTTYTTHYAPGQSPTTTEKPTTTTIATTTTLHPTTTTTYTPKTVSIDESASGGTVDLNMRDKLKLSLSGNPSTGFNWELIPPESSVVVFKPIGEPFFQSGSGVGAGGTYTWSFDTSAQGQNLMVLDYRAPGQDLAAKTFRITVNVDYVLVTERQAGSTINIQQGDVLGVMLAGTPSTGFGWAVTAIDQTRLRQTADPGYQPLTGQSGAGGNYTFRFQTYGQGTTALKLDYLPPGGGTPGKSFQITVNVT